MNLRYIIGFLLALLVLPMGFSDHGESIHMYDMNKRGEIYQISIGFELDRRFSQEDYFYLDVVYDGQTQEECRKQIITSNQSVFKKITCEFQSKGTGEYLLQGRVESDEVKYEFNTSFYESSKAYGHYEFENLEDNATLVRLSLEGNASNVKVYSRIPKEVIPLLNEENKDSLINSTFDYEIIEEDPLIAWNVEKVPEDVEYRVDKEISKEDQERFSLKIEESKTFGFMKFIVGLGIIGILILIILPTIRKNKK